MSMTLARKALQETAARNGVSFEEVYREIQAAIDNSPMPVHQWPREDGTMFSLEMAKFTPEELVCFIAELTIG